LRDYGGVIGYVLSIYKATDRDARSGRTLFLFDGYSHSPLYYRKFLISMLIAISVLCTSEVHAASEIKLNSSTTDSAAGYYQLSWNWPQAPDVVEYSLIEMNNKDQHGHGREIYAGPDLASVISGKRNGTYRYVVQALNGNLVLATSNPVKVIVAHHSLLRAWIVLSIGAFIFLSILVVIRRESVKAG